MSKEQVRLKYDQSTGILYLDGQAEFTGYSGKDRGKNNPALQHMQGIGPIPRGIWRMGRDYTSANVGPLTIPLYAQDGKEDDVHQPTRRSAFRIHGDSIKRPGTASQGCIILPREARKWLIKMRIQGCNFIEVVE